MQERLNIEVGFYDEDGIYFNPNADMYTPRNRSVNDMIVDGLKAQVRARGMVSEF